MANETLAYDLVKESFIHTNIIGSNWLIPLILIGISLFIITRDIEDWKSLAFLVSITWYTAGIRVHILILIATGVIFAINSLSLAMIGNAIAGVTKVATGALYLAGRGIGRKGSQLRQEHKIRKSIYGGARGKELFGTMSKKEQKDLIKTSIALGKKPLTLTQQIRQINKPLTKQEQIQATMQEAKELAKYKKTSFTGSLKQLAKQQEAKQQAFATSLTELDRQRKLKQAGFTRSQRKAIEENIRKEQAFERSRKLGQREARKREATFERGRILSQKEARKREKAFIESAEKQARIRERERKEIQASMQRQRRFARSQQKKIRKSIKESGKIKEKGLPLWKEHIEVEKEKLKERKKWRSL